MLCDELLTKEQVARLLRVKPGTISRWANEGKIPRIVLSPKIVRFDPAAVLSFLKGRQNAK